MDHNRFYVYVHRRVTDNSIFYVGKGTGKRAYKDQKRSQYWRRIVAKHGLIVEIVLDNMINSDALRLEVDLIAFYGRKNLCNMTDGGDGAVGMDKEAIERAASKRRGAKLPPEWVEKIRIASIGRKQSPETIEKRVSSFRGKVRSKQHRENLSKSIKGYKHTQAAKEKMSKSRKGRVITKTCREKISIANSKPVRCSNGMIFSSATNAAQWILDQGRSKSRGQGNITSCCSGALKTAYGYTWSYATKGSEG